MLLVGQSIEEAEHSSSSRWRGLRRRSPGHDEPWRKLEPIWHARELESKARNGRSDTDGVVVTVVVALWLTIALLLRWRVRTAWRISSRARALLATFVCSHTSADCYVEDWYYILTGEEDGGGLPFDETPAPISISGSSTTIPGSIGLPPVPPYSADNIHLRSASVRRSMGMMLIPVW